MSYNTRRGNYNNTRSMTNTPTRQNTNTNFVSGGQYKPNQQPLIQMPNQQQATTPVQNKGGNFQNQGYQTTQPQTPVQSTPVKSILKPAKVEPGTATPVAQAVVPPPATPIVQKEDISLEDIDNVTKMETETEGSEAGGKPKRFWTAGASKISKRERRIRRNRRVGKLIRPKNASMVLNELMSGQQLKFEELGAQNGLFGVSVLVEGTVYEAYHQSKNGAKQKACENALKGYIAKVVKTKQAARENAPAQESNGSGSQEDLKQEDESMNVDENEDISWCQLASFALYKLMDSWQDISEMQPEAIFQKNAPKPGFTPKPSKELPANAAEVHPVMLLYQIRPGTVIEDVSAAGQAPNIVYTVKATIDGNETYGQGPNKKAARKNCAYAVMEKHYGVKYDLSAIEAQEQAAKQAKVAPVA